ncbi:MAG: tetratricopeptide repeat protein [Saprospiraceae bacterium]|nr:tetratricopeptide repeat protein [Saprospiraceae bacterium]
MKKKVTKRKATPPASSKKKNFLENSKLHVIIIALSSFLLYANTFGHDYAQDDAIVITDNMFTQDGFNGISGLLTKDTFFGFFKVEGKESLVAGGRYRPLSLITFAIEREIFGESPAISHLINAVLYALLCVIMYLTLVIVLIKTRVKDALPWFAFIATMLFAFHPIHTEAVANIKGRDEIMAFLLGISAIYVLVRDKYSELIKWTSASILFFLAMMSKENAITLIPVCFLIFWYLKKETIFQSLKPTMAIIAGTIIFIIIRFSILGWGVGDEPLEMMNNPFVKYENGSYSFFTSSEKTAAIIYALGWYLKLLIIPHPLTNDYYPRQVEVLNISEPWVIIAAISLLTVISIGIITWKRNRLISFSIWYFIFTISIFSNIVFPIGTHLSERFLFMPSFGFCLLLAYVMWNIYYKFGSYVFYAFAILVLGLYGFKTLDRNMVWQDDYTLYTTDVKTSINSAKALNAAGGVLVSRSSDETDEAKKAQMLSQSKEYLNKALSIHPNYKNAWLLLGNARFYAEEYEEAIKAYDQSLAIDASYDDALKNLAVALREGGRNAGEVQGDLNKARAYLTRSYQIDNSDYEINRLMGILESFAGNHQEAIKYYTRVTQLVPQDKAGYVLLYNAYSQLGDTNNAEINRRKALQIDPNAFNQ